MPKIPKRPCRYPGCLNLCERGIYCEEHSDYSSDRLRGGAAARGYDAHWRKARKAFLSRHPTVRRMSEERRTDARNRGRPYRSPSRRSCAFLG